MLERYGYKPYAYNAYMLSCKACELFNDFEQKIKELMKDYEKISKPVYSAMYAKVTDMDSEVLQDTSRHNTKEELDKAYNFSLYVSHKAIFFKVLLAL